MKYKRVLVLLVVVNLLSYLMYIALQQIHNGLMATDMYEDLEKADISERKNNLVNNAASFKLSAVSTETRATSGQTKPDGQSKSVLSYKLPHSDMVATNQFEKADIVEQKKGGVSGDDPDKSSSPYVLSYEEDQRYLRNISLTASPPTGLKTKLMVYWQDHDSFPERTFSQLCSRPTAGPCELSFDLNLHGKADAVVFHASNIRIEKPPFKKRRGQIWIARGLESPIHWYPDYKKPAWKGVFNWTFTYRPDSELFAPVGVLVKTPIAHKADYRMIAQKKTRSVAWFVSDCPTLSKREDYVKKLQKHIDVDIYGECGPLKCSKTNRRSCFDMLTEKYRFYLAFENSLCPFYVTEKFFNKFGWNIIPVVRGGFDYKKYIPDGTYINAADFASPKDLAKYLNNLGKDLDAYAAMLERNDQYHHSACLRGESWCKMCDMLHDDSLTPNVYPNLGSWWKQTPCLEEKDVKDIQ